MNYAPAPTTSVMTPQARLTLCFCVAVLLTGPFGFIIGPVMSRVLRRRAERLQPAAAYAAAQRSAGHFNVGQLWAITACGIWGFIGLIAMVPMLAILALSIIS
ncbi:hypothetical protein CEE61_13130 [Stenotrophomonas maltophilia]|uniref:hypothetical protein n=1 Tax=Stenotrophomonas TaxID=40323 RepID=UPI000B4CE2F8|nr:hypothetical protein [Stenotrophomonas sp. 610A2]OWQ55752.1 hypothetical protein CEE61_13130 [Stenotrophomonas maltophilia]